MNKKPRKPSAKARAMISALFRKKPPQQRKLIAGVPHKRVPCRVCKELIWIRANYKKSEAICRHHVGSVYIGGPSAFGRPEDCTHELQYGGDCSCESE